MVGAACAILMGAPELGESGDNGVVPSATGLKGLNKWGKPIVEDVEQILQVILLFPVGVKPPVFKVNESHPKGASDGQNGGVAAGIDKTAHILADVERVGNDRERHRRYLP